MNKIMEVHGYNMSIEQFPRVRVGGYEYLTGVAMPVINGFKYLVEVFGLDEKELMSLYYKAAKNLNDLASRDQYDWTYKNEDHFENDKGGFIILGKLRKVEGKIEATYQFNIFTTTNMVTLNVITKTKEPSKHFITINF